MSSNSLENILDDHEPYRSGVSKEDAAPNAHGSQSPTRQFNSPGLASESEMQRSEQPEKIEGQPDAKEQAQGIKANQGALPRDSDTSDRRQNPAPLDGAMLPGRTARQNASPFTAAMKSIRDVELSEAGSRTGIEELQENEVSPLSTPAESPLLAKAERLLWAQIQNPNARLYKVSDLEQEKSTTEQLTDEKQEVLSKADTDLEAVSSQPIRDLSYTSPR